MRIAFYAPMKAPGHPVPSGDRTLARLLIAALESAGHEVILASALRTFDAKGDPAQQSALQVEAQKECSRIKKAWANQPPDLWFTYHVHYKAPDLLGPVMARHFGCFYSIAEGSFAAKRRLGPWADFSDLARTALLAADRHLVLSPRDRPGLTRLLGSEDRLTILPPFLPDRPPAPPARPPGTPVPFVTIAMMRPGAKMQSYRLLINALKILDAQPGLPDWRWVVVGDGPSAPEMKRMAEPLASKTLWMGQHGDPASVLEAGHTLVWPGIAEGIGMVYLEAMRAGRPVLACTGPAVSGLLTHEREGLLCDPDPDALAAGLARLLQDPGLHRRLGTGARQRFETHHTLERASRLLHLALPR